MFYKIQPTSQKGQVLLVSTDKRGGCGICPVVSVQLPEQRAKQIVAALNFVREVSNVFNPSLLEIKANRIVQMPIEKD